MLRFLGNFPRAGQWGGGEEGWSDDHPPSHCHCHLLGQGASPNNHPEALRVSPSLSGADRREGGAGELQEGTEHWPLARPTYTLDKKCSGRRAHLTCTDQPHSKSPAGSPKCGLPFGGLPEKQLVTWSETMCANEGWVHLCYNMDPDLSVDQVSNQPPSPI